MSLFVGNNLTLNNPLQYKHIYLQNQTKKITIQISDAELNHAIFFERLYPNQFECYINTTRGNYILNQEDPTLHLVNFNKKWFSVGRDYAIPFLNQVDRKTITHSLFSNTKLGYKMIYKPLSLSVPVDQKYKISDRLIVSGPQLFQNAVGGILTYQKDISGQWIIDDILTIPYQSIYKDKQGEFGLDYKVLEMNGFDLLIVLAPQKKSSRFIGSVFIYSYRKRDQLFVGEEDSFYFFDETQGREIQIPRNTKVNRIEIGNQSFHLILDQEILSYYLTYESSVLRISNPFSYSHPRTIIGITSFNNKLYLLDQSEISELGISNSLNGPVYLINKIFTNFNSLFQTEIPKRIEFDTSGIVVHSDDKFFQFDSSYNLINTISIVGNKIIDYYSPDRNTIYILTINEGIYQINYYQKNGSIESIISNIDETSTIPFDQMINDGSKIISDTSGNLYISNIQNGTIYQIEMNTSPKTYSLLPQINNTNRNTKIKVFVSDDSEKVYNYDTNLKQIIVLSRDKDNQFFLDNTICPTSLVQKYLKINDQILGLSFHNSSNRILIGVQRNLNSFVIAIDLDYKYISHWTNPSTYASSLFGYSIDIHKDGVLAVISDPSFPARDNKEKGIIYLLDLTENILNTTSPLRSSAPIGDIVRFSDYNNEIISIGQKENKRKLSWISNIYSDVPRYIVLDEDIKDAYFFLQSQMVMTNSFFSSVKNRNQFYRNHKVNGCFEIMTKQIIDIPSLFEQGEIQMVRLGNHHVFFYHTIQSKFYLVDVRNLKIIFECNDTFNSNFVASLNGNTLSYAQVNENNIVYTICS
jgi:hypothetical protein